MTQKKIAEKGKREREREKDCMYLLSPPSLPHTHFPAPQYQRRGVPTLAGGEKVFVVVFMGFWGCRVHVGVAAAALVCGALWWRV